VFSGVRRETGVVRPEPPVHVRRHADVVPRRACDGSEKVNEALWRSHALECFKKMTERVFRSFARTGQCRFEELATCGRDLVWLFCVVVFAACHPHPAIRLASLGRGACQPEPRRRAGRSAYASRRDGSGGQPPRELRAEANAMACQPEPRRRAGRSAYASRRDGSGGQPPRELRAEAGEPKFHELEPAGGVVASG
jgi:hypothetical protein